MAARKSLHIAFDLHDDLRSFANDFVFGQAPVDLLARLGNVVNVGNARVMTLHQQGRYQVECCIVDPHTIIPAHTHPHADTIEVTLSGAVRLVVNGVDPYARLTDAQFERLSRMRAIRINRADVHHGRTLQSTAVFLSVQRWDAEPMGVLTDYAGAPMSDDHAGLLCQ